MHHAQHSRVHPMEHCPHYHAPRSDYIRQRPTRAWTVTQRRLQQRKSAWCPSRGLFWIGACLKLQPDVAALKKLAPLLRGPRETDPSVLAVPVALGRNQKLERVLTNSKGNMNRSRILSRHWKLFYLAHDEKQEEEEEEEAGVQHAAEVIHNGSFSSMTLLLYGFKSTLPWTSRP